MSQQVRPVRAGAGGASAGADAVRRLCRHAGRRGCWARPPAPGRGGARLALLAYAAWALAGAHWTVPPRAERWLGPAIGAATGLVTAATGVFVIPAVPYLQALGLRRVG